MEAILKRKRIKNKEINDINKCFLIEKLYKSN